jgi:diguanylate cyclase (GGDEF)-like protein
VYNIYNYIKQLEKENKELKKEIDRLQKDQLTGVYNRHYLDRLINEDLIPYLKSHPDTWFSVYLIDLKNLHEINRTEGYLRGDLYIKDSVLFIKNKLKENNVNGKVFRIGGDEFLIILSSKQDLNINKLKYKNYTIAKTIWNSKRTFTEIIEELDKSIINKKKNNVMHTYCRNCRYKTLYEKCKKEKSI